jgi:hypothetical protein
MPLATFRRLSCLFALAVAACSSSKSSNPGALTITTSSLPDGTVGAGYSAQLASSGGASPITWSVSAGSSLPAGLALDGATGVISGTPTAAATYAFTIDATDSASPPQTASASLAITIHPAPAALVVTTTSLPNAVVGAPYAATLAAGGGAQPYAWSLTGGFLPPGVTLAADGTLSGTPTVSGTYVVTVRVADSSTTVQTATASLGITVLADSGSVQVTTASLPGGTVDSAYSATLSAAGGTSPYSWSIASGALPPGLSLDAAGTLSGIPTSVGAYTFLVQVTDSSTPPEAAQRQFTLDVGTAPLTIVTVSLPNGVVGTPYSETVAANGGATPYAWSVSAGALPPGLALDAATGTIAGTPTTAGGYSFTVQAADSSIPQKVASQPFDITIASASNDLVITTTAFADGVTGVAYSASVRATGGTTPYTWSVSGGGLPPGLTLDAATGAISGTPAATGSYPVTIRVEDSSTPMKIFVAPFTIDIYAPLQVTTASLPDGVVGVDYSATIEAAGGLPGYTFAVTSGSLPPGLTLGATGSISGTPTATGSYGFSVQVTDSANPRQTISANFLIAVGASLAVTTSSLPDGILDVAYSQTLVAAGGTPPYGWSVTSGALPDGLALDAATGVISGTPTAAGSFAFTITVTDSEATSQTATRDFTVAVAAPTALTIETASLPGGIASQPYSASITAVGGTTPYGWTISTGALPPGLTLGADTGVISGTPIVSGTFEFTVSVSDSSASPQTATRALSITVTPGLLITTVSLPPGSTHSSYSTTIVVTGGTAPYAFSVSGGALPPGLSLDRDTGVIAGTPITAGTYVFTVTVVDGGATQQTASRDFTIQIR